MPYIPQERRDALDLANDVMLSSGELNYLISKLCKEYVRMFGMSYKTLNEVIGVLECAKTEFYRRVVEPYENKKIVDNGDIY